MRVAIAFLPGAGHFSNVLPVYEALLSSEHEVVLCGSPEIAAGRSGVQFDVEPVGHPRHLRTTAERGRKDTIVEMARASYLDMKEFIKRWKPDLIVCDTSEIGAELAAQTSEVPYVSVVSCGDAVLHSARAEHDEFLADARHLLGIDAAVDADLDRAVVAFGPPEFFGEARHKVTTDHFRYAPPFTAPAGPIERTGRSGRPRAVLSFGTWIAEPGFDFFSEVALGLSDREVEVVMKVRDPDIRKNLQRAHPGVLVAEHVELMRELALADLFVCHGSAMSTLESLYHGTPPLIIPSHGDTYFVAERCAALGVGLTLDRQAVNRDTVAELAGRVLAGSGLHERIADFNRTNDGLPGRDELVSLLERAAR